MLIDEVTEAYEKLHATVSLAILHRAVDRFRFALPEGFEVTQVGSPLLARWDVAEEDGRRVLGVELQEPTTETVVLRLSAIKTADPSQRSSFPRQWRFPKLEPLDVVGQVAVVGLLVEQRLEVRSITAGQGELIPVNTAVLSRALPETIHHAEPGTPPLRPVVAYYSPGGDFNLTAEFDKPEAELAVTTNLLLILADGGQEVRGGFAVLPRQETRFTLDFSAGADWHLGGVTGADEKPLAFERYDLADGSARIHVRLPRGVPPGEQYRVYFHATHTPPGWLGDWEEEEQQIAFPVFAVIGATRDQGAIAVEARDDMTVRPVNVPLTPLDEAEKEKYGLIGVATNLAYRYESPDYQATLAVRRTEPRLTARTFSLLRVQPGVLNARYELIYNSRQARTRTLALLLPEETTPETLSIRGLGGVKLKQYDSQVVQVDGRSVRRWNVQLEQARRGPIHLAVDFQQPVAEQELNDFSLPIVAAFGPRLAYQSGMVAVEGSAELDVKVKTTARRVDVGELVDAEYQPGRRLLGVYGFIGNPITRDIAVSVDVSRDPGYELKAAIVQRAELSTHLSAEGVSQTQAQFKLRTKALYLEVELPPRSELWAASLDGVPLKPQRDDDSLLVSLPAGAAGALRDLRIVYETPVGASARGKVAVPAPKLLLYAGADAQATEVPLSDLVWRLHLPSGYEVVSYGGTVVPDQGQLVKPPPAAVRVAGVLFGLMSGGVSPFWGIHGATVGDAKDWLHMTDLSASMQPAAEPEFQREYSSMTLARQGDAEKKIAEEPFVVERAHVPFSDEPPITYPDPELWQRVALQKRKLEGVRSLQIELDQAAVDSGEVVTFRSLGVEPRLEVTMANRLRHRMLGWGLALGVGLAGLALTNRPAGKKIRFLLIVALLATLVPLAYDSIGAARTCNLVFYAASLLVPYYLLAGFVRWFAGLFRRRPSATAAAAATTAMLLVALTVSAAEAASPRNKGGTGVSPVVPGGHGQDARATLPPVDVPEDAIILPYDPESDTGIQDADKLMVPYAKYVELWNRAHPDKKIETPRPPEPYALAGASYSATLAGDEYLLVSGQLELDVYEEGYVTIPLGLRGGVLARAELDGQPARLSVVQPGGLSQFSRSENGTVPFPSRSENGTVPFPAPQQAQPAPAANRADGRQAPQGSSVVVLYVSGKGRHRLELAVRMRLSRQGGWRVAEGVLPAAPATALSLTVPQPQTELRLGRVADRRNYETRQAGEKIETALSAGGAVSIQWRPKVAEGQVDRSLTARSAAVLDVQEDGLRLVWRLQLEFRRGEREEFEISVPADYLLERVEGTNVRGWQRNEQQPQQVDVTLLQPAKGQESFTLHLWRKGPVGQGELAEFAAPVVSVADAALHDGRLAIRRSPLLDLQTLDHSGATRIDPGSWAEELAGGADNEESPLGIRPYQAYRFVATPFSVSLAAAPLEAKHSATVQTVLKIAEYERIVDSRVTLHAQTRPVYRVEMFVPKDLEITQVSVPGANAYQWAAVEEDDRQRLSVYLATGRPGDVSVLLSGTLGARGEIEQLPLPKLEVLHVQRQQGELAVQLDPALDVKTEKLENCRSILLKRVYGWLNPGQRGDARLALHYDRTDYSGTLRLSPRQPEVTCETITNVRVTDRAVEETILLDFSIRNAGIRELSFLLPEGMDDCRIQVPMLRQKRIEPADEDQLRVWIQLQEEKMGQLQVLIENDRPLTSPSFSAPIPTVVRWRTDRQYVVLESASRDEVVVDEKKLKGLEVLSRQQKEWDTLQGILGAKNITQAYLVVPGAQKPQLVFTTKTRKAVQTAGARIGLAETVLIVDTNGAYRAAVTYRLDNTTEQFLEIELPPDAELWTAQVAGEPVKPAKVPGAAGSRLVRIPLVKTAPGDRDFAVVLIYGGTMPALGSLGTANFPVVQTKNINVELSQLSLFVPRTHRLFAFGGTMGLVAEEADLAAGRVAYDTKQGERLAQVMRGSDKFAKVRAAHNLKQWGLAMSEFQSSQRYVANPNLQAQLESNALVIQQAEQEIEQLDVAPEPDDMDNRFRLNARFEDQKSSRSRNVVQDLGNNWSGEMGLTPSPEGGELILFNGQWLYSNQLDNPAMVEKAGAPAGAKDGGWKYDAGKPGGLAVQFRGSQPAGAGQGQPSAPEVAQGATKARLVEDFSRQMTEAQDARRSGSGEGRGAVLRYQEQLQQQAAGKLYVGDTFTLAERWSLGKVAAREEKGDEKDRFSADLDIPFAADGEKQPPAATVPGGAAPPTGLASLELQLPRHDEKFYRVYRFSTPRGEVEITAWSISNSLWTRLLQLAAVAAAVAVLAYAARLVRAGRLAWLGGAGGSWLLIAIGLLALLFGVLPVAGLVALVAGIVIKIRRAAVRRAAAAQPIAAEVVEA